ncbi:MAG: histidine kinase dimerization/phosphoacceptor domain -containing protein [Spirochaetota bacterium]
MGLLQNKRRVFGLRSLLILVTVVPMVVAVSVVGALMYFDSRSAMRFATESLYVQVNGRIADRISGFLSTARTINDSNAEALSQGSLRISDPAGIESHLIAIMRSRPLISSTYVGSPTGGLVDSGRDGPGGQEYVIETPGFSAGPFVKSAIDDESAKVATLLALPFFDARNRPWYQAAVAKGSSVWTEVFALFSGQDSAISAARPVFDRKGKLIAVVSVDLFLSQIRTFLEGLGRVDGSVNFLIDRKGFLIASPHDATIFMSPQGTAAPTRMSGKDSRDPLVAMASQNIDSKESASTFSFTSGGKGFTALASTLSEPADLGWRIVSVFPNSAYTGPLERDLGGLALIALLSTALFALGGISGTSYIVIRTRQFSSFAAAVADGVKTQGEGTLRPSSIREIEAMRQDFLAMERRIEDGITRLRDEIDERRATEERLTESQHAYDRLARNIPVGFYLLRTSPEGRYSFGYVSPRFREVLGLSSGANITGPESYMHLIHPSDLPAFLAVQEEALRETKRFLWEGRILAGGTERHIRMESNPEVQSNGDLLWDGVVSDVTETRLASGRISELLSEKELLLHEVHHRIKNNMYTMTSMLEFQADMHDDPRVSGALMEARDRLTSMMLLYNKLYRSDAMLATDTATYLGDIAGYLEDQHSLRPEIIIERVMQPLTLDVRVLMPLGIIVNELITNSYKHAFPRGRAGRIRLSLTAEGDSVRLTIDDDGVGQEPGKRKKGFGRFLIEGLSKQIRGTIEEGAESGSSFSLVFPRA